MKLHNICKSVCLFLLLSPAGFAAGRHINVEFDRGQSSVHYSGEVRGNDYDVYTFSARKGQKVQAVISAGRVYGYLFGPGISDSVSLDKYSPDVDGDGMYILPESGKYELRVLQTRNDARRNKVKKYNIDILVK